MKTRTIPMVGGFLSVLLLLAAGTGTGFAAPVSESEAIATADAWIAMELNSGYLKINEAERSQRSGALANRQVLYLTGKDDLLETRPGKGRILAYVVKYQPSGYVIVAGDDRIEPVIAFDVKSQFRWDQPDRNFMRHFLGHTMPARWKHVEDEEAAGRPTRVHANWAKLRKKTADGESLDRITYDAPTGTIYVLWDTALWDQGWPYNTEVVSHNGGNSCPTGCTATAMAIKFRFHEWPITGSGSRSYNDTWGTLQYSHSANFGAHTYNWANMPTGNVTSANQDVADLMYHCGVAVSMDYEPGGSGAWPTTGTTNTHFRYKGTTELSSDYAAAMMASIRGGLPVIVSSTSHTVLADGYRDTVSPYYHMNAGWSGGSNGWYNLPNMPAVSDPTIDRTYPYSSPNNYIYVDANWGGTENGNIQNPYNTLSEGNTAVPNNGWLWIKTASYAGAGNVPITFNHPMLIRTYEGTAVAGGKLRVTTDGMIRLHSGGGLKIY